MRPRTKARPGENSPSLVSSCLSRKIERLLPQGGNNLLHDAQEGAEKSEDGGHHLRIWLFAWPPFVW